MAAFHVEAMFGDMPLLIASIETDDGRDIAVQSPARGSRHFLQDRGAKLGKADCEILFVNEPGKPSFTDRFERFRALVAQGEPQIFSHPLLGVSYRARAEGGRHSASADALRIVYRCAFLPEEEPQPTVPIGASTAPAAGLASVTVAVAAANGALASTGLSSSVPSEALEQTTALSDSSDFDPQAAIVGVATLTGRINDAIAELDLAAHIERWPAYQAFIGLIAAVQRFGDSVRSDVDQLISLRTDTPRPLLAICQEVYGAELAAERADQVARLNRIRTPNRVPAGTTLKLPAPRAT
jgi:hypothetical protein